MADDLFTSQTAPYAPLAERLRPRHLDEVVGQTDLVGEGKPLRVAFASGRPHSMIFWGPPGVGKTTLARMMAQGFDAQFIAISAVLGGVKDIRDAVVKAQVAQGQGRRTILFVDEVHRFNKAQQDAFLPYVESGLFTFIGATTENPSFEVNSALLSRARVYVLQPLTIEQLETLVKKAIARYIEDAHITLHFTDEAQYQLAAWADGDARRVINAVEVVAESAHAAGVELVDQTYLEQSLSHNLRRFDKGGDAFYDQISALHKSVRGSDPNAALYWFSRMLDGGADASYLSRRIVRIAWEDIGLADPRAMQIANEAAATFERLGSPEGELALAQALLYLAIAPKSNAGYMAYNQARRFAAEHGSAAVPVHLRNAPTQLMKQLGHGKAYRYAHDEPHAYAAGENYFPEGLNPRFYTPTDRGLEQKIAEKLRFLTDLDRQSQRTKP
ncbi:recombination factor protein RarA [Paenalcaligenes hominis]|uniref:Replication-associated recombination protein A n=1 Tax=Paenalcaligenes hominis TaxID=643674 RepID=A0A1U9JZM7_9BURK|nr:replication-associated recombination protein A [Paenalcaligenes hominis]AQS51169.1 recombination factor protein RarA [Paenalcaligenes hominis]